MEAYDAAWAMWEAKKREIDATLPRKHQQDDEQCILGWEKVLAWSSKYGDKEHADQAERKLVDLRRRFAAVNLTPLSRSDWFESLFDSPDYAEIYAETPQDLFDQAVTWLGQEYGLVERPAPTTPDSAKPDNSEAQPTDSAPSPELSAVDPAAELKIKPRSSRAGRPSTTAKSRPAASRRSKAARKRPAATANDAADSVG